jgi:dihydrofolate reductase
MSSKTPQALNKKPIPLTAIVAMDDASLIGAGNELPWKFPEDLRFFKETTTGNTVVMGRKTFESIGKPLPNRRNIVLTKNPKFQHPGIETIHSPEEIWDLPGLSGKVFIIGGAEIYKAFLPHTKELLVTHIPGTHSGDTYFPDNWQSQFQMAIPFKTLGTLEVCLYKRKWSPATIKNQPANQPAKKKQQTRKNPAVLRVCASCRWIFRWEPGTEDKGCPKCQFGHYGARYVFGKKAYRHEKTQEPWKQDKLWKYRLELEKEIDESTPPGAPLLSKKLRLNRREFDYC